MGRPASVADAAPPFVSASRGTAVAPGFHIFPANRKDVSASLKEAPEQSDLRLNWRVHVDAAARLIRSGVRRRGLLDCGQMQRFNFGDDRRAFAIERRKPLAEFREFLS